jgi:signal transduction histidine kinase
MGVERPVLLHVPPPLHTRPWFVALSLAAIGAASLAAHRMRLARARQRFEAVLDERNRIARDVHDTLAQSLVAVSVQIETIRAAVGADPETLTERLDRASQAIDAGVEGARRSVRALRSPDPGMNRLESELRNAAALLSGNTPVHVTVTGRTRPLPSSVEEHLLRIGQEALTNAVRHARARSVQVRLHFSDAPRSRWRRVLPGARWAPRPVTLTVSDDGVGFDADVATPGRGLGLVGLRERARELGARLTIDSRPGRGTVVQVELTI